MIQIEPAPAEPPLQLPHPSVHERTYARYVRTAPRGALTPESLAADYRAACKAGLTEARDAAALRLFAADADRALDEGFLRPVRVVAERLAKKRPDLGVASLSGMILDEIYDDLPTPDGEYAERDWSAYCYQKGLDVSRRERRQKRLAHVHDAIPEDHDHHHPFGDEYDPDAGPLAVETGLSPGVAEGLWRIVERTADEMPTPEMALITRDQFGRSPSKQSGTKWVSAETGKQSLTVQLGWDDTPTDRDRVRRWRERARKAVKANVLHAIAVGDLQADPSFLRDWRLDPDS